ARVFLERPRGEALRWLVQSWAQCLEFDELCLVPQLHCEGNWQPATIAPRRMILDRLGALPTDTWFKTQDLIDDIYQYQPDFLRSGADYNTWIISSTDPDARLLHGFEHWQDVEGQYIRFLIEEMLVYLGMVQTGQLTDQPESQVFQIMPLFSKSLNPGEKLELPEENQPVLVGRDGKLEMTPLVPRIARYQLSRFAEWRSLRPDRFVFQLTPASLQAAAEQGLELKHLRTLLRKYGKPGIPPGLQKALTRWESHGVEARIEPLLVLRLAEPELLGKLRESKASGCLGETLGPTAVLVKPGCGSRVRAALRELGILTDLPGEDE
ncbi:MAG: helicase-associated domain-containing protein, partial [Anaerolineaceae bacterium]